MTKLGLMSGICGIHIGTKWKIVQLFLMYFLHNALILKVGTMFVNLENHCKILHNEVLLLLAPLLGATTVNQFLVYSSHWHICVSTMSFPLYNSVYCSVSCFKSYIFWQHRKYSPYIVTTRYVARWVLNCQGDHFVKYMTV